MDKAAITMSERARLSVDVSELLHHPGTTKRLRSRYEMEGIAVPLARVPAETEVEVDLRLDGLVDGIHVSGQASCSVVVECRRCLRTLNRNVRVEVDELFVSPAAAEEDDYVIAEEAVDLEPMLRDTLILALPLNPVCREDCRGLCPTCGADLNDGDHEHDPQARDIRLRDLEALRRRMMEG